MYFKIEILYENIFLGRGTLSYVLDSIDFTIRRSFFPRNVGRIKTNGFK